MVSSDAFPSPSFRPFPYLGSLLSAAFFQARFSWCYRILLILHVFGADAFCPVFINLPAPIFMMYLAVSTNLYFHPCPTCFCCLFPLFHYCFCPKSSSFSDAKIVCSWERPMASANGVSAKIFLYQAFGLA